MKEELKLPVMLKPQRYAFKGGGGKIKKALAKCDRNQMKPRSIKIIQI